MVVLAYWLLLVGLSALFLRLACSLFRSYQPTWRRAIVSTLVITFLAYLTFDYSAYVVMLSLQDVVLEVPPWYGYANWFHEPPGFKWLIISQAGPLRYLPIIFGLCVAGILQVMVLQGDVTFRYGLLIVLLQWGATVVAGYVLALLLGLVVTAQSAHLAARPREPVGEPGVLQMIPEDVRKAAQEHGADAQRAWKNLKAYGDSHLAALNEDLAPLTSHLPEPIQRFLAEGGWWWVLGVLGVGALLQVGALVRKVTRTALRPRSRKKKRRKKGGFLNLKEDLAFIGDAYTDPGPQRLTINGVPARLRLVLMALGSRTGGELTEEMADRVLDWIKPGLAKVTAGDYPRVRVWPLFPSLDGFALALAQNAVIPERKGEKSPWVLVSGQVRMGPSLLHVGLALYADEASTMRHVKVQNEQWLGVIGIAEARQPAGAR
jgi:hypothetical protein